MIIALVILGLCLGSFINALVWRLHEQTKELEKKKPDQGYLKQLSISKGRSLCTNCGHDLAAIDLIPIISWLSLRGKCRYCHRPISWQYPLVEASTAVLFVVSYYAWPSRLLTLGNPKYLPTHLFQGTSWLAELYFGLWLLFLTGLMALLVYDLRWFLLPNRLIYPLTAISIIMTLIVDAANPSASVLVNNILAVIIGGGIFYALFQLSEGKWIGGGDVKLGWLLGLVVGTPAKAILFIFLASVLGSVLSLPLILSKRLKKSSIIPFGPFLIVGFIITVLWGQSLVNWYVHNFILHY